MRRVVVVVVVILHVSFCRFGWVNWNPDETTNGTQQQQQVVVCWKRIVVRRTIPVILERSRRCVPIDDSNTNCRVSDRPA